MAKVWIVKAGHTVPELVPRRGDFPDWFRSGLGLAPELVGEVEPPLEEALPAPKETLAAVVTGSSSMATDAAAWSLRIEAWLRELVARKIPVLGVCYGHQLLARALGGRVDWNPKGREIGSIEVRLNAEGRSAELFGGLPQTLLVQASHSQSVTQLPAGAQLLAGNDHDAMHSFAVGTHAFGIQFHPEFDADIARGYIEARAEAIRAEGLDVEALLAACADSEHGARILANFARMATSAR